ncbi:hypothetical protein LU276_06535 [Moraxella haemolytica]|uniref:hypothetical protein n=1 Tax=Moraxella haemolytica TaxID=2904119 RepID=UPI002542D6DB|nr:hypothetical protein [Moraxella sp. ZY171148]WII94681.1 hypothetical protein LU276_06535 [Moraxella sp. ZY171148]
MLAFNRPTCNLQAQEQLISDAIASGVPITILPDYTPKPRPAHSVKSWKVMDLPKPKLIKKTTEKSKCHHASKTRRQELLKYLKTVHIMTAIQVRDKFGYANPGKVIARINSQHDRPIIAIERFGRAANNHPAILYRYIG